MHEQQFVADRNWRKDLRKSAATLAGSGCCDKDPPTSHCFTLHNWMHPRSRARASLREGEGERVPRMQLIASCLSLTYCNDSFLPPLTATSKSSTFVTHSSAHTKGVQRSDCVFSCLSPSRRLRDRQSPKFVSAYWRPLMAQKLWAMPWHLFAGTHQIHVISPPSLPLP